MSGAKLPESFRGYFWDVDFHSLTLENAPTFILKRLLDRGDTDAIVWMGQHYTRADIKKLLLFTRDLSQKTASFWADVVELDHKKVPCLLRPYSPIQFGLYS